EDDTRVSGTFEAALCKSTQQDRPPPAPIHGLAWEGAPIDPKKLPAKPLTASFLGKTITPAAVEIIDWKGDYAQQHELHIYIDTPTHPCAPSLIEPGFVVSFGGPIVGGAKASARSTMTTHVGDPFGVVVWKNGGNVIGMEGDGAVTAIMDSPTRGRVYAWF